MPQDLFKVQTWFLLLCFSLGNLYHESDAYWYVWHRLRGLHWGSATFLWHSQLCTEESSWYFRVLSHARVLARSFHLAVAEHTGPSPFRLVSVPDICWPLRTLICCSKCDSSLGIGHPWWPGPPGRLWHLRPRSVVLPAPHPGGLQAQMPSRGSEDQPPPPGRGSHPYPLSAKSPALSQGHPFAKCCSFREPRFQTQWPEGSCVQTFSTLGSIKCLQ